MYHMNDLVLMMITIQQMLRWLSRLQRTRPSWMLYGRRRMKLWRLKEQGERWEADWL